MDAEADVAPLTRRLRRHPRKTCSDRCEAARNVEKAKEAVAAGIMNGTRHPARVAYLEKLKADRVRDRTRTCPVCGRTWQSVRRSKTIGPGVCSFACRTEWVRGHDINPASRSK